MNDVIVSFEKRVSKAKVQLLLKHPFFATFALKRPIIASDHNQTAWTDGEQIGYCPEFFAGLSDDGIIFVIAHEVLHIAGEHHLRIGERIPELWNRACDYVINDILKTNGFVMDEGVPILHNPKYTNWSPEQVYNELFNKLIRTTPGFSGREGNAADTIDSVLGAHHDLGSLVKPTSKTGNLTSSELEELKASIGVERGIAMQAAQRAGKLPAGIGRMITEVERIGSDWKERLAAFMNEFVTARYSLSQPNRRYLHAGIILPGQVKEPRGKFVFAFDTSGSIDTKQLNLFAGHLYDIMELAGEELTLIHCDAKVAHVETLEPGERRPLQPKGGGGTNFAPVSKWIEENNVDAACLIYFTDGNCTQFASSEVIPTMWATDNLSFCPPHGDVVYL